MPLNLEAVNRIQDGQAVTADNLNAPSVNLEGRTDAIKASYDVAETERVILRGYSTTLRGGSRTTLTVTAGELVSGGAEKFYSLSLSSGTSLRYASPLTNMGRLEVTRADLSTYANNDGGNDGLKHLVKVGDTLAVELSSHSDLASAPDASLVGAAQTDSNNLGSAFLGINGDVNLVKLPLRRTLEFNSTPTLADILSDINVQLDQLSEDSKFLLNSNGVLQTGDAGGAVLEITASGGEPYSVVYSMEEDPSGKIYITTTSETSFLNYNTSIGVTSRFRIRLGDAEVFVVPANQTNKAVKPGSVDLNKIYIPVATLEEDGVRIHGVGTCPLPAESGDVEVIGPNGRSTKAYLPGETHTVETVLSRASGEGEATTSVVSIPEALAEQIQDYGGHVLLKTFSITTLSSFASGNSQPTFTATARLDQSGATITSQVLASGVHMPSATNHLETSINVLADAIHTSGSFNIAFEPSVSVTVSGLDPDSNAKALLRLSFSYVPA